MWIEALGYRSYMPKKYKFLDEIISSECYGNVESVNTLAYRWRQPLARADYSLAP